MTIRLEHDKHIIRLVFSETVNLKEVNRILEELEPLEKQGELEYLDRISDLRTVTKIDLNFAHVYDIAQRRKSMVFPRHFKSAIVADTDLAVGFSRMFQTLNKHPHIDIQIFRTIEDAEDWTKAEHIERKKA